MRRDRTSIGIGLLALAVLGGLLTGPEGGAQEVGEIRMGACAPIVDCCAASMKVGDKIAQQKMQYVFQLSPTARDMAVSMAAAVAGSVKPQKVALLNENTDGGRDFSRVSREWFAANARGVEIVTDEFVDRGVTDLTPQLTNIK